MKKFLILTLLLSPLLIKAQDMQQYSAETKELVKHGEFKKALERYIWYHDHALEHDKALVGVRLSFALSDWKALAMQYPPALVAMQKIREKKTKQVSKSGSTSLFADVVALNRTLGEDTKSVDLFKTIIKTYPDSAKKCFPAAKPALFAANQYDIIRNYLGDPMVEFRRIEKLYTLTSSLQRRGPSNMSTHLKAYTDSLLKKKSEDNLVKQSVQLIQYAKTVNDLKSATEIQQKASAIVNDPRLIQALKN